MVFQFRRDFAVLIHHLFTYTSSQLSAPPRRVPADVVLSLERSTDLEKWAEVLRFEEGTEVFSEASIAIQDGQIVDLSGSGEAYFRYRATLAE